MNRILYASIFFTISSIFLVDLNGQSFDKIIKKEFTGELYYQSDTFYDILDPTPQNLQLKSVMEVPYEQAFSYKEDIQITGILVGDTSSISLCSETEDYIMFPPSSRKVKFKVSEEIDIRNYTRTNESKIIAGFNCIKYYFQVNDKILVEKWITKDFGYSFPQNNMGHCYSMFSEEGFQVANKITAHSDNGYSRYVESVLTNYIYDSTYVRISPKLIFNNIDDPVIEFEIPEISDTYQVIAPEMRKRIQLDSLVNESKEYINGESFFGQYTLISFWAPWCKPCLNSMPKLERIFELFNSEDLNVLSIMIDQNITHDEWLDHIEEYNMKWFNVRTEDKKSAKIKQAVGFTTIPSYLLVDNNGRLVFNVTERLNIDNFTAFLNELIFKTEE